jgi:hypothetical protein
MSENIEELLAKIKLLESVVKCYEENDKKEYNVDYVPSRSEAFIKSTHEYLDYRKLLYQQQDPDASRKLEVKYKEIYRKMDRERKKRYVYVKSNTHNIKVLATEISVEQIQGANNLYNYNYNELMIKLPTFDSIMNKVKFFREINRHVSERHEKATLSHLSYISFKFTANEGGSGFTRKIAITDKYGEPHKDYKNTLYNEIKNNIDRINRYDSVKNRHFTVVSYSITYKLVKMNDIKNWFDGLQKPYLKFKDFKLFLAAGKDNCMKQCVEYLGGEWTNKKLEDMLPQKKIIRYKPIIDINHVTCLNDIVCDYDEDVITNDCKNVARILEYNGHMGVICEIFAGKKQRYIQKQRRYNSIEEEVTEVYMDIEAYSRKNVQIPYLLCWGKEDNIYVEKGENCVKQFIDKITEQKEGIIVIYAWYGSGYDYQHILSELKERCISDKYIIKNSTIMYAEMKIRESKLRIVLKDPYLFLLTSLDRASKAFNVMNKGSFPHEIIKSPKDLNKILPKWVKIQRQMVEEKTDNKLKVYVRKNYIFENLPNYKTTMEKAIEYCKIDVIAMREVWKKFKDLVDKNLNININTTTFTLSQLSMKILEASLGKKVELHVPNKENYEFIKKGIYGGRVIAKNGVYEEDILYADVVSLYPSAMKLLDHAYGKPEKVNKIDWEKNGIYDVTLTHKENIEPEDYLEFIPRRLGTKLSWDWFKQHRGTYHTYDLLIAKEQGFKIECHEGIEYPEKGKIFDTFINKLYKLKDDHSKCSCEEQPCPIRMVAKIALNGGGYGKFVQKPIEKETYIVERDTVAAEFDAIKENDEGKIYVGKSLINKPKFFNLDGNKYDKMVIEREDQPVYATQCGVSILSGSRYRLYNLCKKYKGIKIIYSDTDSIFVKASSVDKEAFAKGCGTNLGDLDSTIESKKDQVIDRMIIAGRKMYAYEYDGKVSLHCKGVPTSMLSYGQFEEFLKDEVIYKFDTIKKGLTGVKTRLIDKKIRQTY